MPADARMLDGLFFGINLGENVRCWAAK